MAGKQESQADHGSWTDHDLPVPSRYTTPPAFVESPAEAEFVGRGIRRRIRCVAAAVNPSSQSQSPERACSARSADEIVGLTVVVADGIDY